MENQSRASIDETGDSLYEKKWNAAFARLRAFKARFGHCRVPNRFAEDPQLGNWVSTQRRQFRILTTGVNKTVPLTQERAQQLINLGFEWSAKDPSHKCWEDRFKELCEYKRTYGSTLVPMGWKENPRLSTWVSTQRQEYKELKAGHSSRLNEAKVQQLNAVGFVWEAQRGRRKLPHPATGKKAVLKQAPSSEPKSSGACGAKKPPPSVTVARRPNGRGVLLDLIQKAATAPNRAQETRSVGSQSETRTLSLADRSQPDLRALIQNLPGSGQLAPRSNPSPVSTDLSSVLQLSTGATQSHVPRSNDQTALLAALAGTKANPLHGGNSIAPLLQNFANQAFALSTNSEPRVSDQEATLQAAMSLLKRPARETELQTVNLRLGREGQNTAEGVHNYVLRTGQPASQNVGHGKDPNNLEQLIAAFGKQDGGIAPPQTRTPLNAEAHLKRRIEDLLVAQSLRTQRSQSSRSTKSRPSDSGSLLVATGGPKDDLARASGSLASPENLSEVQALGVVRLYAASLPTNSSSSSALLAAASLAEAQKVLKADILRILVHPQQVNPSLATGAFVDSQTTQPRLSSQALASLLGPLSGTSQPSGSQPASLPTAAPVHSQVGGPGPLQLSIDSNEVLTRAIADTLFQESNRLGQLQSFSGGAMPPSKRRRTGP